MLGEGESCYLRKSPCFLGGSEGLFFCRKRPEEDGEFRESCDVERGDVLWRPLDSCAFKRRVATKDSLLFVDPMAVDEGNAATRFPAPLEKGRWNWSNGGHPWGGSPSRQGSGRGQ